MHSEENKIFCTHENTPNKNSRQQSTIFAFVFCPGILHGRGIFILFVLSISGTAGAPHTGVAHARAGFRETWM